MDMTFLQTKKETYQAKIFIISLIKEIVMNNFLILKWYSNENF